MTRYTAQNMNKRRRKRRKQKRKRRRWKRRSRKTSWHTSNSIQNVTRYTKHEYSRDLRAQFVEIIILLLSIIIMRYSIVICGML